MDSQEAKQVVRQLACDWVRVELPTHRLTYTDYLNTIAGLNGITEDTNRTAEIVTAVINQAKALGYSSEWVQSELKFEAQAQAVGDRSEWLLTVLQHAGASDAALDQYNERKTRLPASH